jgi:hypothetical protein
LWRFFIPTAWLALCLTTPLVTAGEACKLLIASGNPRHHLIFGKTLPMKPA